MSDHTTRSRVCSIHRVAESCSCGDHCTYCCRNWPDSDLPERVKTAMGAHATPDRAARDEEMRHIGGRAGDWVNASIEGHLRATPDRLAEWRSASMKDPEPLRARPEWTFQAGPSGVALQRGRYGDDDRAEVYIDLGQIVQILREGHHVWYPRIRDEMKGALDGDV